MTQHHFIVTYNLPIGQKQLVMNLQDRNQAKRSVEPQQDHSTMQAESKVMDRYYLDAIFDLLQGGIGDVIDLLYRNNQRNLKLVNGLVSNDCKTLLRFLYLIKSAI